MENFALVSLVENLRPGMADVVIRRVIQHQANGFIFQTRSPKFPGLKLIADPLSPALYASEARPPAETPTMDFLMVLRKHLTSAELVSFSKLPSERIVEFSFKTAVPTRELETMTLVLELLPNAPNLILLDAERRVVSSFLPITPQHGMGEYEPFAYPKTGNKIALERFLGDDLPDLGALESQSNPQSWLISHVAGLGPVFAAELVHRQRKSGRPMSEELRLLIGQALSISKAGYLYTDLPLGHILDQNDIVRLRKAILSPVELESLERTHSSRLFVSITDAAKFYFDELESRTLLDQAKSSFVRGLRDEAKRMAHRERRLVREQKRYEEAESMQKTASMLNSSGMKMDQRVESVAVMDYFQEKPREIRIPLDPSLTLRENIDKMFKKYQKAERGKSIVAQQIGKLGNRRALLDEQLRKLQAIKDWDTWLAVSDKIEKQQHETSLGPDDEKPPSRNRFRSVRIGNREILIGRNGRENDELTFHVAMPDDFWFHVADYSGSHVVVRNPQRDKELDEAILTKAAELAAYHSQARNSSGVEVHYTRRKHVTKPRRAKPGLVRLLEFKSIKVEPKNSLGD